MKEEIPKPPIRFTIVRTAPPLRQLLPGHDAQVFADLDVNELNPTPEDSCCRNSAGCKLVEQQLCLAYLSPRGTTGLNYCQLAGGHQVVTMEK